MASRLIHSFSDKAKLFAGSFVFNAMLDDKTIPPYLTPPPRTEHKFYDVSISSWKVSKLIKSLTLQKLLIWIESLRVIPKNLSSELSPVLTKLFNHYLKKKCFWKSMESVSCMLFTTMRMSAYPHHKIASLVSSANFLRLSSTRHLLITSTNQQPEQHTIWILIF